jgi:hypothetical protein
VQHLEDVIGLGVAGNFTGHLEQAGEARDFTGLAPTPEGAPKGIFPFYVPGGGDHFLNRFPLSSTRIALPDDGASLQLEPELAMFAELVYDGDRVSAVRPHAFAAYNDCSIRRDGANKISAKKNWGTASKGVSEVRLPIDRFEPGGVLDHYRIACLLVRDGAVHDYGVDSPVPGYSYFYGQLLDWLVDRLNAQRDEGPLEDMPAWLARAGSPRQALISVGATRYTPFGEHNYLRAGDEAYVLVYDARAHSLDELRAQLPDAIESGEGLSVLHQRVG